jgi:small-conductance mechanosensitive channel
MTDFFQQPLATMVEQILTFIPHLMLAMVIFFVGLWLAGWVAKLVRRAASARGIDPELVLLFSRLARWSVIILATIAALEQVNFNVAAFVGGLGIVGFTVGFALKDIAENFVAGVLLLWQQPFDIGDAIEVQGYSGTVTTIDLRATAIQTFDGLMVIIPNAIVYKNPLTNYSELPQRRVALNVGVAYDSDLEQTTRVALDAIGSVPGVIREEPAPAVAFNQFGGSSIDFTLYYWIQTEELGFLAAQDAGVKAINSAFKQAGIEIPFPISTLLIQDGAQSGLNG